MSATRPEWLKTIKGWWNDPKLTELWRNRLRLFRRGK